MCSKSIMILLTIVLGTASGAAPATAKVESDTPAGTTPLAACTVSRTQMPVFFQQRIVKLYGPAGECAGKGG